MLNCLVNPLLHPSTHCVRVVVDLYHVLYLCYFTDKIRYETVLHIYIYLIGWHLYHVWLCYLYPVLMRDVRIVVKVVDYAKLGKCLMLGSAGMYIYIHYTYWYIYIHMHMLITDYIMLNINTSPTPCTLNHSIPLHPTRRRNRRRPQKLPSSRIPRGWDGEWWYNGDMMASSGTLTKRKGVYYEIETDV